MMNFAYYGTKLVLHGLVAWFVIEITIQLHEQREMIERIDAAVHTPRPAAE